MPEEANEAPEETPIVEEAPGSARFGIVQSGFGVDLIDFETKTRYAFMTTDGARRGAEVIVADEEELPYGRPITLLTIPAKGATSV